MRHLAISTAVLGRFASHACFEFLIAGSLVSSSLGFIFAEVGASWLWGWAKWGPAIGDGPNGRKQKMPTMIVITFGE